MSKLFIKSKFLSQYPQKLSYSFLIAKWIGLMVNGLKLQFDLYDLIFV